MQITDSIKAIEQFAEAKLSTLRFPQDKIAAIEAAKALLRGAYNGRPARAASPIAMKISDELTEIMTALFRYHDASQDDMLDCIALIMDFCALELEG